MALLEVLMLRRVTLMLVRMIRRLLVTVLVLGVIAVAGNSALGRIAERRAATQIRASLHLSSQPSVRFDGFPIVLRILQGHVPHATVDARDLRIRGLDVARFHLSVDDLRTSISDITSGRGRLRVGGGEAFGEVTDAAANAYLASRGEDVHVAFTGDGPRVRTRATYGGTAHDVEARGTLSLQGNDLVFVPSSVTVDGEKAPPAIESRARNDASFRVPIPALPGGVRPRKVSVSDGLARLEVTFGPTILDLGNL